MTFILLYYVYHTLIDDIPLVLIIPLKKKYKINLIKTLSVGNEEELLCGNIVTCTSSMAIGLWRTVSCSCNFNYYNPLSVSMLRLKCSPNGKYWGGVGIFVGSLKIGFFH